MRSTGYTPARLLIRISLRDYESTAPRVEFLWKFVEGNTRPRESGRLFSLKSNSTRGCDRSRNAPKDAGPAICESRVAPVWYGPKENSLRLLSFLGFKAGFLSQAARRSSTMTIEPSLCLFQSFERIIRCMTHTFPVCYAHTMTHNFQTLYVWRSCLAGKGTSVGEKRSISDSPTFSRRAGDPSRLECASPTHIERASRIGGGTSAPAVP